MTTPPDHRRTDAADRDPLFDSALEQFRQACHGYNRAVGSFNTHLDNHRDRRDLYDLSFRTPITAHDAFSDALEGDQDAIESVLDYLLDQAHLDSMVRRHPRTFPIHREAVEHLEVARADLVTALEDALHRTRSTEAS